MKNVIPITTKTRKINNDCITTVASSPIKWLWPGRIPLGKMTLLVGDPGCGKSLLTCLMAAHVSTGRPWPVDGSLCPQGATLLFSAEDDVGDTIKPRLIAADADLDHVISMGQIEYSDGTQCPFSLLDGIDVISDLLDDSPDVRLIIIDPVSAFLESTDANSNTGMRAILNPWMDLAAYHEVAIVLVTHMNKSSGNNAMYRAAGSIALPAACRSVFSLSRDPLDEQKRLFLPIKNNLSPDSGGLEFTIKSHDGVPIICWANESTSITATQALAPQDGVQFGTDEAVVWLKEYLANGPANARTLQREAKDAGISDKCLRVARERLEIHPKKVGGTSSEKQFWTWELPPQAQG